MSYIQSQIAKKYLSVDKSYRQEDEIDKNTEQEKQTKNRDKAVFFNARTKVKCNCCKQTQFFRDDKNIYIKCTRCKTERQINLMDIMYKSSEYMS